MTIQIAANATTAKLMNATREQKLIVQQILSYTVDGAEHMGAFKAGSWDGKSSFFTWDSATFPRGFLTLVAGGLIKQGIKIHVARQPLPAPLGPVNPKVDDFPEEPRYDYQPEVVEKLLKHGQIIAQVATGGGKSRIAKLCVARIQRPTLFLTTRGILMHQMAVSFADLGRVVGVIGDGEFTPKQGINVGMVQTIISKLKGPEEGDDEATAAKKSAAKARMIKVLEFFEFVILEEAHEVSGNSFFEILKYCKNAHYRLALTATPFMKDSQEANMRLQACSGPVAIRISEKLLIERGILAKPYFKFIKLANHPKALYRSTPWQRAVKVGIVEHDLRNKHIAVETIRARNYGLSTMILVQRQDHGQVIHEMLAKVGVRSVYIFGENDQAERQAALAKLKSGAIDVLIGSTILDVGVDVPAVGLVILAGGGKAEVALRQRIGRGLREKKGFLAPGAKVPNVCFILDFTDDFNNHLKDHAKQRRHIIKTTEGFGENIVEDFPYAGVGLRKMALAA
jgi:superfamily II DNA or RNA helicase